MCRPVDCLVISDNKSPTNSNLLTSTILAKLDCRNVLSFVTLATKISIELVFPKIRRLICVPWPQISWIFLGSSSTQLRLATILLACPRTTASEVSRPVSMTHILIVGLRKLSGALPGMCSLLKFFNSFKNSTESEALLSRINTARQIVKIPYRALT